MISAVAIQASSTPAASNHIIDVSEDRMLIEKNEMMTDGTRNKALKVSMTELRRSDALDCSSWDTAERISMSSRNADLA